MKLLFENWRGYLEEVGDPDSDADNEPKTKEIAKALERNTIEDAIQDASFNSAQTSQHRWSRGQPIVDYRFDENSGVWKYTATIPGDPKNPDNWEEIEVEPGENLENFLQRVKDKREKPHQYQLSLLEDWRKYVLKESNDNTWYHTTHETTADAVEEGGLYTDHGGFVGGFTLGGHWADEIYGMRPVYLSKEPNKSTTREYEGAAFEVDVGDDLLLPDLPSLEDHEANKEDDHFWWSDRDEVPEPLQTYMNNAGWGSPYQDDTYNDVYFEELTDPVRPRSALQQAVIDTTGTAVSLRGYSPDEIKRVI